jgi:hypothetical protein
MLGEDPRFMEGCHFEVIDLYKKKTIETFEGTFIDALTYLHNHMRDIQDEGEAHAGS